jgi:hypothetical protein
VPRHRAIGCARRQTSQTSRFWLHARLAFTPRRPLLSTRSATMDRRYIVPVEPATGTGDVVVLAVRQNGPRPLDVQLVACEGRSEDIYVSDGNIVSKLPSFLF